MGYAFELYFNKNADQALRSVWRKLLDKGLLSPDLQGDARPHISLCVCDELDRRTAQPLLEDLCAAHGPFGLVLGFIGTFLSSENVIFVAPGMTEELRRVHAELHDRLGEAGASVWEHYLPDRWQPHCTMAINVPEPAFMEALDTIRDGFRPMPVAVESIGLVQFRPVRLLREARLGGRSRGE